MNAHTVVFSSNLPPSRRPTRSVSSSTILSFCLGSSVVRESYRCAIARVKRPVNILSKIANIAFIVDQTARLIETSLNRIKNSVPWRFFIDRSPRPHV
jgi:hypothetical protein